MRALICGMSFLICGILLVPPSWAGDKVGNGGGIWACSTPATEPFAKGFLVDLFEAREEFQLSVPERQGSVDEIVNERLRWTYIALPELAPSWEVSLGQVREALRLYDHILENTNDALLRSRPSPATCPEGEWTYLQMANFTEFGFLLVRRDLWEADSLSNTDRAALLFHEAIYKWLRQTHNDVTSVRTRTLVGHLFADLPAETLKAFVAERLATEVDPLERITCTYTNRHHSAIYLGYGETTLAAKTRVRELCRADSETGGAFCSVDEPYCEPTLSDRTWTCQVKNRHESTEFLGKGRSRSESLYQARIACEQKHGRNIFCFSGEELCESH